MNCKRFNINRKDFSNCADNIKRKCCCISKKKHSEIKNIAKLLICAGVMAILILCFPPSVWFVIMAVGMIILGIKLIRF